jgi:hypothetical protein
MNGTIDDDNHASEHWKSFGTQTSMDMEAHGHNLDADLETTDPFLTEDDNDANDKSNSSVPVPEDDDSFGEASKSLEPNQQYLDQILEDYHLERLNLLGSRTPEPLSPLRPKTVVAACMSFKNKAAYL